MEPWTYIIACEQPIFRQGIRFVLERSWVGSIEEADNVSMLEKKIEELTHSGLVIISKACYNKWSEKLDKIRDSQPSKKAYVLLMANEVESELVYLVENGSLDGIILEGADMEEWSFVINRIESGKKYISTEFSLKIPGILRNPFAERSKAAEIKLNPREKKILELVAEGYTNKEIADRIFASQRTVEAHRMRLIGKTGARNTATLVKMAVMKGLID